MPCAGSLLSMATVGNVGNQPTDAVQASTLALHTGRATEHLLLWFEMLAGRWKSHALCTQAIGSVREWSLLLELLQVSGCAGAREAFGQGAGTGREGSAAPNKPAPNPDRQGRVAWRASPTLVTIGEPKRMPS